MEKTSSNTENSHVIHISLENNNNNNNRNYTADTVIIKKHFPRGGSVEDVKAVDSDVGRAATRPPRYYF